MKYNLASKGGTQTFSTLTKWPSGGILGIEGGSGSAFNMLRVGLLVPLFKSLAVPSSAASPGCGEALASVTDVSGPADRTVASRLKSFQGGKDHAYSSNRSAKAL